MTDNLNTMLQEAFPGKIVRKDLTKMIKEGANVPVYVLEYLLGMYCATDDEESFEAGVQRGIYYKSRIPGHWGVDKDLALQMSMTLNYDGNQIASYNPSDPLWWITSFNPAYQNVNANDLSASFYFMPFSVNGTGTGAV